MKRLAAFFLGLSAAASQAQVPPMVWSETFTQAPTAWHSHGETSLFVWDAAAGAMDVTWDSARTNSYFYLPLGLTLTRADDFKLTFKVALNEIAIGTTEGKPYTFQIAVGLLNVSNAFDPEFYRGAGVDAAHGARNLVEFNYFPDSGFGATVAPTIATASNNIAFSGNYPLELAAKDIYRVEMQFDAATQTLNSRLWRNDELYPPEGLKPLKLSTNFADFRLNAIAISSYSDAGQTPPFAGSIQARGWIDDIELTVWHRLPLQVANSGDAELTLRFPTEAGWTYQVESSSNLMQWTAGLQVTGQGAPVETAAPKNSEHGFFRVRAVRPSP